MGNSARLGLSAAMCVWLAAIALPVSAQITSGTVLGTVKDPQGGVVPGATVVLINEAQGTRSAPVVTSGTGDFVFVNVTPGTYTVEVEMSSFKTLRRSGVPVSPGSRVALGTLILELGGTTEVVNVKGETPVIQSSSGERSFTVSTDEVSNLPLSDRNFATLASLAPGVSGTSRIGGGGATNFMMDGVGTMDTGSNRLLLNVNVESIAQVKVLTSSYQAEYGRSSGLQITAVTKSGTNRFHGSGYDVERNSDWNPNSKVNKLNGDPKATTKQREWGYSIGGPIGKPGGNNQLFFFYSQEFQPRTAGNNVSRFRFPTALERAGNFSQTTDNNGNPYPYIKDPQLAGVCNPTDQTACFLDDEVLGKIPANRLYETGLNILKMFPLPNRTSAPGAAYNYEIIRPNESLLAYQPAIRLDYQPIAKFRTSFKYTGWSQRKQTINGSLPGFNDTRMQHPVVSTMVVTANYNLGPTTFLEGTYGRSGNEQAGCALTGAGPTFCTGALPMNAISNRVDAGLGDLPFLFPDANVLDPAYYAYGVLNDVKPPIWDGTRIQLPPSFSWGGRVANAPPNIPFPGFLNVNRTQDVSISMTKVAGRHTMKTGFYNTHSFKAQQRGGWNGSVNFGQDAVGTNPYDTSFGFANAAVGTFSSYNQASKYVEGVFIYNNTEGYIQDNWKVNSRLTLDYGVRLVHQQPQYDKLGQASNFLPEKWNAAQAPVLYAPGCVNNANPCSGTNRQARNPLTGELLGRNSTLAIGTLVPNSGNTTNGLFLSGQGIAKTTYTWPVLALAPRFGMAYDLTGRQRVVLRGGAGLFYDRPDGNAIFPQVENPPTYKNITVRYGQLQTLGKGGLTTEGPPSLAVYEYNSKLPASWQWNTGVQMMLRWAVSLDMSYVGQHSYHTLQSVNLNSVDLDTAFLREYQDPTLPASMFQGATAVSQDQMRAYRGYSAIQQQWGRGWRTHHSLQLSFQRRFRNGFSFGFNDTVTLYDRQAPGPRLQHNADGSFSIRPDQAEADRLFGNVNTPPHIMKGNFVWDLPHLKSDRAVLRAVGLVINDWQAAGIWSGGRFDPTSGPNSAYTVGYGYQNGGNSVNLTGSQDYGARIRVVGDPGSGCSSDPYRQFNTKAFEGPLVGSVGLESSNHYLHQCFISTLDLSIARVIRLGGARQLRLRLDMFNAPNAAGITGRNASINLTNPNDPVTATNLPFLPSGELDPNRSRPRGAGFGVANNYQNPRSIQAQVRFSF
jgi:hypothetical protein